MVEINVSNFLTVGIMALVAVILVRYVAKATGINIPV